MSREQAETVASWVRSHTNQADAVTLADGTWGVRIESEWSRRTATGFEGGCVVDVVRNRVEAAAVLGY